MDGNGRWASRRALPRHLGHRAGVRAVRAVVEGCARRGVEALTLFAFSSENWGRPNEEVARLMELFIEAMDRELDDLDRNGIRLRFIGDRGTLKPHLIERIAAAEARTEPNANMTLYVALSYGGRWDIVQAARRVAERVAAGDSSSSSSRSRSSGRSTSPFSPPHMEPAALRRTRDDPHAMRLSYRPRQSVRRRTR
jgi:undecaprenyl diphosphate synthase